MSQFIETIIEAHSKDLGDGVKIKRLLPHAHGAIGPYVFFDFMPDIHFKKGTGMDVRPHPHIGLSTLTYLLKGRNHHRDSLENSMIVDSGDVLLMTSGNGIVHSERSPEEDRIKDQFLHGYQFWLALPKEQEDIDPFIMFSKSENIPLIDLSDNLKGNLAIGEFNGNKSPVHSFLSPVLINISCENSGNLEFKTENRELAVFVEHGELDIEDKKITNHQLVVFKKNSDVKISYKEDTRFIIFGGESLDGHRHIWWNLVSSDQEKIEKAKIRWKKGDFPIVPNDPEFIPLPDK